ncbi:hypothetical protein D3C71_1523180 [compost metagenome]
MVAGQGAGHATVLVHLDRVNGGIAARVVPVCLRLRERGLQLAQALAQDVRETHQQRQFGAGSACRIHDLRQRNNCPFSTGRADHDVPCGINVEITIRPVGDRIGLAGLFEGPIAHRRSNSQLWINKDAHSNACGARLRYNPRPHHLPSPPGEGSGVRVSVKPDCDRLRPYPHPPLRGTFSRREKGSPSTQESS